MNRISGTGCATLAVIACLLSSTAYAQSAPDTGKVDPSGESAAPAPEAANDGSEGAEIIVTAQFRSQRLQDIPLAITALNAQNLTDRSATQISDITSSAPSVLVRPSPAGFGPAVSVFIRGVGQGDSSFALEPGVGLYVDDVYFGSLFGANFDLMDLDRVEVLRGPQGTLAGKNSIGGAIKLYSLKPTGNNPGFVEATYGSRNHIMVRGASDLTLVPDKLYARISGVYNQQDGFVTRYDYGCRFPASGIQPSGVSPSCVLGHEGGKNYGGARLALRYEPTASLKIDLAGSLIKDTSENAPTVLLGAKPAAAAYFNGVDPALFVVPEGALYNYGSYATPSFTDPARYAGMTGAGTHPAFSVPDHLDMMQTVLTGTIGWDLADHLSLTAITGWTRTRIGYGIDIDASPVGVQTSLYQALSRQFSQELRLSGDLFDKRVEWTLGGYYYKSNNNFSGANILYPSLPIENLNAPDDDAISSNKSLFGQVILHATDRLNLTGGLRYTHDQKDYTYRRYNPFLPGVPTFTAAGALTGVTSHYEANKVDYRLAVDYRWSDGFMTYAQVSTGFRGGGTNPRPFVPEQAVPFYPETITSYEAGFKSDFFDRRLRLNLSAFVNDYNNIIFTNVAPTANSALNATPTNVGKARYSGVEAELTARPVEGLVIDASASYLGFKLKSLTATGVVISGVTLANRAPFAPEWKASLGIQYKAETGIGSFTPRLDYSYQSSYFTNINDAPEGQVRSYSLVNARLTFEPSNHDWQISVAAKNLLNERYYTGMFYNLGLTEGTPAPGREVQVTLRRNF